MITIKRGDSGIGIEAVLYDNDSIVDLNNSDVLFLMKNKDNSLSFYHEIHAVIVNASQGEVRIVLEEHHTSITGDYIGEFEVTFNSQRIETFPNDSYIDIKIMRDLGGVT